MPTVELIYDSDCPNVQAARDHLQRAFSAVGLSPGWTEWNRADSASPPYVQHYGSPTILVDGQDIAGQQPRDGASACRVYDHATGPHSGVPPVGLITTALRRRSRFWRNVFPTLPGISAALLPVGRCPACWPAYAGVLASLGVPFLLETTYLLPLVVLFFAIAIGTLGYRARVRRGYGPLALGSLASLIVIVGKFALLWNPAAYVGAPLLFVASLWNAWPHRTAKLVTCPACQAEPGRRGVSNT